MSMLWPERYSDNIAKARGNSPCCAPDGIRSSRIIAPAALVCHIPVTNCLIARHSQFHTVFMLFGNMPLWLFTVQKIFFSSEVHINSHTQEHLLQHNYAFQNSCMAHCILRSFDLLPPPRLTGLQTSSQIKRMFMNLWVT